MSQFVVIPRGDGYIGHENVDPEQINLPGDAEIYEDRDGYAARVADFDTEG